MEFIVILFEILIIPAGVVWYLWYRKRQSILGVEEKRKRLELLNTDALSECFFLFAMLFWGSFLYALKIDFHTTISWQTIVLLSSGTAIIIAYRYLLRFTLLGSMIGILVWWIVQASEWLGRSQIQEGVTGTSLAQLQVKPAVTVAGFIFLSLLAYVIGRMHEKMPRYNRFAILFTIVGLFCVTGVLFLFSQKDGLDTFESMTQGLPITASWQLSVMLAMITASLIGMLWYVAKRKLIIFYELYVIGFLAMMFLAFLFLPHKILFSRADSSFVFTSPGDSLTGDGFLYALFFNVLLFLFLLGIIFSGYQRKEVWRINLGAGFLFIFIFLKYFDWFFTYLDKSVFFISAGILLFVVGYFMERGRRMMISVVKEPEKEKKK